LEGTYVNPVFALFGTATGKVSPVRKSRVEYDSTDPMSEKRSEDALVARIARQLGFKKSRALPLRPQDDAALWLPDKAHQAVLTCDWFLEGSHFLRDKHPPDAVGWKCLARAVSDIAAMGGGASCFLLSLALPSALTGKWLDEFLQGLRLATKALHCEAAGGDTTRQDKVLISITVVGQVRTGRAILRSGARPGDLIYVSGTLGEADLGLRELKKRRGMARPSSPALRKHLYPEPRLALGQSLAANRLASAMMDISDGLSTDLPRLCAASGVGAHIRFDSLPVSSQLNQSEARQFALHGGDEYELLFTVNPRDARRVPAKFRGLPLTRIGTITRARKVLLEDGQGVSPLRPGGWDPFR
jgi:thiamine-monophosphate kinase